MLARGSHVSSHYDCPFCNSTCDVLGDCQVECAGNKDIIYHYDTLRGVIFSSAQAAALGPMREVPSLIPFPSSRPADNFMLIWTHGKPTALGVLVISTMQHLLLHNSSSTQGFAISGRETIKFCANERKGL